MNRSDKIFIAGASGMAGSAIIRNLVKKGYTNLIGSYHSKTLSEQKDLPLKQVRIDLKHQESVKQFFTRFLAVMPTNRYGPNDNFSLETSHALPALIRKFHEAQISDAEKVVIIRQR